MPNNYHDQSESEPVECQYCFSAIDGDNGCCPNGCTYEDDGEE